MARKAHLQNVCIWLAPCRWLIPQVKVQSFPRGTRVYSVLVRISPKVLKILYKLRITVSCPVTGDQPGKLIPLVGLCSSHVPCGEKDNCNYLGAAFHHHLASFVLLYTTPHAPVEPGITLARIFTALANLLFTPTLHSRTVAGLLMLRLSNRTFRLGSVCVCAALSILLCCDWFAKTHSTRSLIFFYSFKFSTSVLFHEGARYCNKLQNYLNR